MKNPSLPKIAEEIAVPLETIASPQRIAILLAIGEREACVCHLETTLGWRQAYISQHLMALRKAGILEDRREGRYVYYRLRERAYLDLLLTAADLCGLERDMLFEQTDAPADPSCACPHCTPRSIPVAAL